MIGRLNLIIADYQRQGYSLTVRQLFYRALSRGWILNTKAEYDKMVSLINNARIAGLIDWTAIVDRTRSLKRVPHWANPSDIIEASAQSFRQDKWRNQGCRLYVLVEKDALGDIVGQACNEMDVPWGSCRGYMSQTMMWDISQEILGNTDQDSIVIHLGDHDPSGLDMTRDNLDRLELFTGQVIELKRIALNMDQIQLYNPPPAFSKKADTRAEKYIAAYGVDCWELDALDPAVLKPLIQNTILEYRDAEVWAEDVEEETHHRELLAKASEHWDQIAERLEETPEDDDL